MQRCYLLTADWFEGYESALEMIAAAPRVAHERSHALIFDRIRADAIRAEHWTHAHQAGRALHGDRTLYTFADVSAVAAAPLPAPFKGQLYTALAALSNEYQRLMREAKAEYDALKPRPRFEGNGLFVPIRRSA